MIYPTVTISPKQSITIDVYDTDYEDGPVLTICNQDGDAIEAFYNLLMLFMNQYQNGWEDGYWAGFEEAMETEEEGDEEYWN